MKNNIEDRIRNYKITSTADFCNTLLDKAKKRYRRRPSAGVFDGAMKGFIMNRNFLKISTAAVTLIIICVIMFSSAGNSIALAEVYQRLQSVAACSFNFSGSLRPPGLDKDIAFEGTIITSEDYGAIIKTITHVPNLENPVEIEMYMLLESREIFTLTDGTCINMEFNEEMTEQINSQAESPRTILERMLKREHVDLGNSVVDGRKVVGYRCSDIQEAEGIKDMEALGIFGDNLSSDISIELWVDCETFLPVKYEFYSGVVNEKSEPIMVMDNFDWDLEIDPLVFSPEIPEDVPSYKLPSVNEETMLKGLEKYSSMTGSYPESMEMQTILAEISKLFMQNKAQEYGGSGEMSEQQTKKLQAELLNVISDPQGAGMFYAKLVTDDKAPVYLGNNVEVGDAESVLLYWVLDESAGTYRVVFGDLTARDLEWPALEALLPKQAQIAE